MPMGNTISKVLDVINKILAFAVLVAYVIYAINANWTFITNDTIMSILSYFMYYGPIGICALVLLEFSVKRNVIIQILCYLIIIIVVVFQFFPETFSSIATKIGNGNFFGIFG